jgi:multisubunit Na+/H+ antiporter MnhE subunit
VSKARAQHAGGMFDRPARLLSGAACIVFFLWYAFTASHKLHELLVGVVATSLTVWFFSGVLRTEKLNLELRLRDLAQCWRLPKEIIHDCWVITVVLFKDLFGKERAGSFYRACGFKTSRRDPLLMGRTALAVAYTTASPNMLVIGIDPAQSLMLFHQIQRDKVSEMTRRLGAQQ